MGGVSALTDGVFERGQTGQHDMIQNGTNYFRPALFDVARVAPVANRVRIPAWGALACAYLGQPAS